MWENINNSVFTIVEVLIREVFVLCRDNKGYMNSEDKLYWMEQLEQEKKANKRIIRGFEYVTAMFFFIYCLCVVGIFDMDFVVMTATFVCVLIDTVFVTWVEMHCDLTKPWVKYAYMVVICIVTCSITSILTVHALLLHVLPLLFAIQCRQTKVLWFTYGINMISVLISSLVGFYFGICDLNILIHSNYRRSYYLQAVWDGVIHLQINDKTWFIIIFYEVVPLALILFVFTLMLNSVMKRAGEDQQRITNLTWSKERDSNTGVYNKNKYEEMVEDYYRTVERVSAIYWDLNDLKITNDKYGHEEGDALIALFSKVLLDEGDQRYRVYRLGGDEFLLVIDDPKIGETDSTIKEVLGKIGTIRTPKGLPISAAVGWNTGEGKQIRQVVKSADANMYENKLSTKKMRKS